MADKVIQMQVRNASNTAWDNLNPKTKASAVLMENGKSVEESVATHLADYTLQVPYAEATGTTNIYSVTLSPAPTSLVNGLALAVKIPVDSTSASTLNVNGLGAKTIKKANGANVTNLKAGGIYTLRYDGVNFILQGEGASGNATASDLLLGKTATTDAGEITGTIPIKSAATITPGTTNQVIAAGQYLSGAQTVLGDADLIPANIKSGINIFGVAGNYSGYQAQPGEILIGNITDSFYIFATTNLTKAVEFLMTVGGTYRISFQLKAHYGESKAQIYVNGVAKGTLRSATTSTVFTEDITIASNDYIQIYCSTTSVAQGEIGLITIGIAPFFTTTIYENTLS